MKIRTSFVFLLLACSVPAVSQTGTVTQVTSEIADITRRDVAIDSSGFVYALSNTDPLGTNPQRAAQLFRWSTTGVPEQLTFLSGGAGLGRVGRTLGVSESGSVAAFASNGDPLGTNADGNAELFLWSAGGGITQLTDTTAVAGRIDLIVACDNRVVFTADYDYFELNPERVRQLYSVSFNGTGLLQHTTLTSDVLSLDADATCDRIVFETQAPLLGTMNDDEPKVFGIEFPGINARVFKDGTSGTNGSVAISGDGTVVSYIDDSIDAIYHPWDLSAPTTLATGTFLLPDLDFNGQTATYYNFTAAEPWWMPSVAGGLNFPLFQAPGCDYQRLSTTGAWIAMTCSSGTAANLSFDPDPSPSQAIYSVNPAGPIGVKLIDNELHVLDADLEGTGGAVLFVSNLDPLGIDPDRGGEVYRRLPTGQVVALTTTTGTVREISASSNGYYAFLSDADLLGFNPDGSFEVYVNRVGTPALEQITNLPAGTTIQDIDISPQGVAVAFVADDDPFGSNADGSVELSIYYRDSQFRSLITASADPFTQIKSPKLSQDGEHVVFASSADYLGLGGNEGLRVFLRTRTGGTLEQLSDTWTGFGFQRNSGRPDITFDATQIVFESNVPDGTNAVYRWTEFGIERLSPNAPSGNARISTIGGYIAFDTEGCLFDRNGSGDRVTLRYHNGSYERAVGLRFGDGLLGIGDARSDATGAIDDSGRRVLNLGYGDPTGDNPSKTLQAFLVDFEDRNLFGADMDGSSFVLNWKPTPQARRYDVIRGDLDALGLQNGVEVDLGTVVCIDNDSTDNTATDSATPAPGAGFFYLLRGSAGDLSGVGDYGVGSLGGSRTAAAGDCGAESSPSCAHDTCTVGVALSASGCGDPCVEAICAVDAFCCTDEWDALCASQTLTVCDSLECDPVGECSHSLCEAGAALQSGCDSNSNCVVQICAADSFCCNNFWDGACIEQVETVCDLTCENPAPSCGLVPGV